jgi:hypothetical protein
MKRKVTPLRKLPTREIMRVSSAHFWAQVEQSEDPDACWGWTGTIKKEDGSAIWLFNRWGVRYRVAAHRASAILHGLPVEDSDDVVYRTCRSVVCTNPRHLAVGDHMDNVESRHRAGHTARGEENGRAKLTAEDVAEIKLALRRGASNADLAEQFGVSVRAIWGIANDRVWKHVQAKGA